MGDIRVTCINKPNRNSSHEHITHLGNSTGKWTVEDVIAWIENRQHTFHTHEDGKRADIGVVTPTNGRKYVRTYADGRWTDNLLALTECP